MDWVPSTTTAAGMSMYWIRINSEHLTSLPDSDDQRREEYTSGPPFSQPHSQFMPRPRHIHNRDSFNITDNYIEKSFNDQSVTHSSCKYEFISTSKSPFEIRSDSGFRRVPPGATDQRVRPQRKSIQRKYNSQYWWIKRQTKPPIYHSI